MSRFNDFWRKKVEPVINYIGNQWDAEVRGKPGAIARIEREKAADAEQARLAKEAADKAAADKAAHVEENSFNDLLSKVTALSPEDFQKFMFMALVKFEPVASHDTGSVIYVDVDANNDNLVPEMSFAIGYDTVA